MALTPKQMAFCEAFVECGVVAAAYRSTFGTKDRAIMGDGMDAARQNGHELMKRVDIQAMIFKLARERMSRASPTAIAMLEKLATDASSEAIRLAAATKLLELSGFKISAKTEITIVDERSDDELEAFIRANLDIVTPKKLDS